MVPSIEDIVASINDTTKDVITTDSDTYFECLLLLLLFEFFFFPLGCATCILSTSNNKVCKTCSFKVTVLYVHTK